MTIDNWIMVAAVILGPILAVQAQKAIEAAREKHQRRMRVFETLMATRGARLSLLHVESLNRIDLEYGSQKGNLFKRQSQVEKEIIGAWRQYLDHLGTPFDENTYAVWNSRGEQLFVDLLFHLSRSLGFDFDRVHLQKGVYSPQAHFENEQAQIGIRNQLLKVLSGQQHLNLNVLNLPLSPESIQLQEKIQALTVEYYESVSAKKD